jgi:hypothetical protein
MSKGADMVLPPVFDSLAILIAKSLQFKQKVGILGVASYVVVGVMQSEGLSEAMSGKALQTWKASLESIEQKAINEGNTPASEDLQSIIVSLLSSLLDEANKTM